MLSSPSEMEEIRAFYDGGVEETRLQRGLGQVEYARTLEILLDCLPPPPAVVYDVGGGAGAYTFWLTQQGYSVHLFDLSPGNVALARAASLRHPHPPAAIEAADARYLPRTGASAEVVLLMGPLYHLMEREERLRALGEACRVLKPGGRLVAAAVSRFALTLYGLRTFGVQSRVLEEPEFLEMIFRELADGQHIRPARYPNILARAFFHLPEELLAETQEAGFHAVDLLAVEGLAAIIPQIDEAWADPDLRETILRLVRAAASQPSLLGISPHFLAIGTK